MNDSYYENKKREMEQRNPLYEKLKKYAVTDVSSVDEFLGKYYKARRYTGRGPEYAAILLASHQKHMDTFGYDMISRHDSNTGEVVTFYG